jgi:hypothetical protein
LSSSFGHPPCPGRSPCRHSGCDFSAASHLFLAPTLILRLRLSFLCNDNVSFGILRLDKAITYLKKLILMMKKSDGGLKHITVCVGITCYQVLTILNIFFVQKIAFTKIYRALNLAKFLSCFSLFGFYFVQMEKHLFYI